MPLNTAVPSDRRISAPAPEASTSGTTPKMKANEVIRIGRSRSRDASSVASKTRLAFLRAVAWRIRRSGSRSCTPGRPARPGRSARRCSRRGRCTSTPATEQSRHSGTTRITASGSDQLSYSAARARNTQTIASRKTYIAVLPAWICMNISSVHSVFIDSGSVSPATLSMSLMASPVLTPGCDVAVDWRRRCTGCSASPRSGRRSRAASTSVPSGTIWPLVVADLEQVDVLDADCGIRLPPAPSPASAGRNR